ncbi:hypothetical protein WA026_005471 [Henosepilachna vigintioctopunctata]|uniref:Alanine aminotransferase 1 n=1 Tax=Henosepilachna vigintioctopunctata TaxID=420089 RepID=A0AAW1TSZ6_9CUCU
MLFIRKCKLLNACTDRFVSEIFLIRSVHKTHSFNKFLTTENVNPNLKCIDYAIRGLLFERARNIEKELLEGASKPFKNVLHLNIGDPQSLGQPPITFLRQVLTLVTHPVLLDNKIFPEDAKIRAREILAKCPGHSAGSYSDACGMEIIRRQIAKYIEDRDKIPSHWKWCYIGHGASDVAKKFFNILKVDKDGLKPGILNPSPGYPFYLATIAELGMKRIDYLLDEDQNWNININELQRTLNESRNTCNPRVIVVINPGNPTSHVMSRNSIEEIVKFAHKENLIIMADEVYQHNIFKPDCNFVSFKKVMNDLGEPYSNVELVSLMSISKGYYAESGIKGGFGEVLNMDPEVTPMFVKSISAMLCPSVLAQAAVYASVNPPKPNEPSYEQFLHETGSILGALKTSASIAEESFNSLEGVSCNRIEGSIFGFPQITIPKRAIEAANKMGVSPDEFYALELLSETGICVVPGSGFKQPPGKYFIRLTLVPKPDELHKIMERFGKFHHKFLRNFSYHSTI